jgi:SAM-dependent methyltransferase
MFDHRHNLANSTTERLRPYGFHQPVTRRYRLINRLQRFFDLQAASIWRDLAVELPKVRGRLLDVGCGAQPYRQLLPSNVVYLGIDTIDAKMHFGYDSPDTVYFAGETWPVETASVDVVLCTEVLEHVADPVVFLREMYRCLRPAGRAILTVPFAARWHFIPHDYWRFTPAGLHLLLEQALFTDIRVYARGNALTVACYKLEALMLPLFFPQNSRLLYRLGMQLMGLVVSPVFLLLAIIGSSTLALPGKGDCLGYTTLASRGDSVED